MTDRDPKDLNFDNDPSNALKSLRPGPRPYAKRRRTSRKGGHSWGASKRDERYTDPLTPCGMTEGLPSAATSAPKKPAKPVVICAGVPDQPVCHTVLDKGGMKKRCSPCSDLMHRYRMGLRGKAKTKERKGASGGNTPV